MLLAFGVSVPIVQHRYPEASVGDKAAYSLSASLIVGAAIGDCWVMLDKIKYTHPEREEI